MFAASALQIDQQDRDVGRIDAGQPCGLSHRGRPEMGQLLARLVAQPDDAGVIEIGGDGMRLQPARPLNLLLLFLLLAG